LPLLKFQLIYKTSKVSLLQQAGAVTLSCLTDRHHHPSHSGVVWCAHSECVPQVQHQKQ